MSLLAPTPSQTIGPFFHDALCRSEGPLVVEEDAPDAIRVSGRVLDGAGEPVPDALVETWQAAGFGRCPTDAEGRWAIVTVRPAAHGAHAPHLALAVSARGLLRHLVTRMYLSEHAAANAADPLLAELPDDAARATLVGVAGADGYEFDIHLQGEHETVFLRI